MSSVCHPRSTTPLADWLALDDETFRRRFEGTPILRARRDGFLRNVCIALGNRRERAAIPALAAALARDTSPLVRAHAAWALGEIGGADADAVLQRAARDDDDDAVRIEASAALRA